VKSRLKVLRAERDLTQEQLATLVGVSRYAINALETERHDPTLVLAYRISTALSLPIEQVFPNPYAKD